MKKISQSLFMGTTALTIALIMGSKPANALTFMFSQLGWTGGGEISGMFSGQDINGDNKISSDLDEVFSYTLSFQGNTNVSDFNQNLTNLEVFSLEYTLGSSTIDNLLSQGGDPRSLYNGTNGEIGQGIPITSTVQPVSVQEVSEPTPLLGIIILGLGVYVKKIISSKSFK
jgi:hypothetical protein